MRLLTPAIKYWVCKSAPGFLYEAMECLGGNGYVEEGILARHYRESPVNAIWEGSGNVMCLDVLRRCRASRTRRSPCCSELAGETHRLAGRGRGGHLHRQGVPPRRTASASRGWRSRSWRCWRLLPRSMPCRRGMPNCSPTTRLAGNHASMYGAVDLASGDVSGLLERALP